MKTYKAEYTCMVGNLRVNRLISEAGLGITGAYKPITYEITWKPGEHVTWERAEVLCEVLKNAYNETATIDCQSVTLDKLYITK